MKFNLTFFILPLLIFLTTNSYAETTPSKRGLITSSSCPYSCKDTNIPENMCREFRIGNVCKVEDLTKTPGHRTLIRIPKNYSKIKEKKLTENKLLLK